MALSFQDDIRPFFRDFDVDTMKNVSGFDLSDYEDVRDHADDIYQTVSNGSMPCDEPWSDERVATFKQWIDEGMKP